MNDIELEYINCPLCLQPFNENKRMPMLLPDCGHSYCLSCLGKHNNQTFLCPEDGVSCFIRDPEKLPRNFAMLKILKSHNITDEKSLIDFNDKNFSIAKLSLFDDLEGDSVQPRRTFQSKIKKRLTLTKCQEHDELQELVCLTDKRRICPHCALFGSHKGHDVCQESEVKQLVNANTQKVTNAVLQVQSSANQLADQQVYWKHFNEYRETQIKLQNQIKTQFKVWRKILHDLEMQMLDNLHAYFAPFDESFKSEKNFASELSVQTDQWLERIKLMLEEQLIQQREDPSYVSFELADTYQVTSEIQKAEELVNKINVAVGYESLKAIDQKLSEIRIDFEPNFEFRMGNLCKINACFSDSVDLASGQNVSSLMADENEVLVPNTDISRISFKDAEEINDKKDLNSSNSNNNSAFLQSTAQTSNLSGSSLDQIKPQIRRNTVLINDLSEESKQLRLIQPQPSMLKAPKKLKESAIATAFKTGLDIIDLSGKSISDSQVNELIKMLQTQRTIRQLDISCNKITDEGALHISKAICELPCLENLILSSNKLSEKCIEPMAATLRTNKVLKTLDLTGNGISNRVVKNKIKNSLQWVDIKL